MKNPRQLSLKKMGKQDREHQVLLGLVDHYILTGKPVGSHTLQEAGFDELSSATIRNYFANLEDKGYLSQPHSSGGRIPTDLAFRTYAQTYINDDADLLGDNPFESIRLSETREISTFLQQSAEQLSVETQCAVFLSAPRFDHDFVVDIKLVAIDPQRCLCVLVTDFGVIKTEVLPLPHKLTAFAVKRLESYFHWRLTGLDPIENLTPEETALGQTLYHEVMIRYIVGYSTFIDEDLYRTGFSRLLSYPEYQDATLLASSLSLFENTHGMRQLLRASMSSDEVKCWIGDDLATYTSSESHCSVLAIPYHINRSPVGALTLLGPTRIPYRRLFNLLRKFSLSVSEAITRSLYKFKVSFRQPEKGTLYLQNEEHRVIGQSRLILLEDNRKSNN